MRSSKFMLGLLIVLFVAVAGMFYYQNFYVEQQENKNTTTILVAKQDIPQGAEFTSTNVGAIKISKDQVLDTYITNFKELEGLVAQTTVFKNEVISNQRVESEKSGEGKYRLTIKQSNFLKGVEPGETVRIFVKPRFMSQLFEVLEMKEIHSVNFKTQGSGQVTQTVESIEVLASDEEIVLYERALSSGNIVAIKYADLSDVDKAEVLSYEKAALLIEYAHERARDLSKKKDAYFARIHEVQAGETWSSIANKYKTNTESLIELNPTTGILRPGTLIQVN